MTTKATRRDFIKSATVAAAGAVIASTARGTFFVSEARAASYPAAPSLAVSDMQAQLEEAIKRYNVAGASAAIFHRDRITTAAAGVVNNVTGVEMTPDTVMHIGSITKIFNTTIVMQLVDDGLVELDAPVVEYLPEFRVKDRAATRAMTVKMLLNHTSGIDGEILPDFGHDDEIIEKAIPRFAEMGQIHDPGKDCSYCNTAVVIAGYLAQKIRGESWYDQVKERIFQPLEMNHAIVLPEDALLHRASVGHHLNPQTNQLDRTSFAFLPMSYAPAGASAMMSASDLVTFGAAHMGNGVGLNGTRILSRSSANAMRTKTAEFQGGGAVAAFGLGWMLGEGGGVQHGGGGPGIISWFAVYPEQNLAVSVLTNTAHGMVVIRELMNDWVRPIAGVEPLSIEKRPIVDIDYDPRKYVGTYENIALKHEVVEKDGDLGMASTAKFKIYDSSSTERGPVLTLKPVGGHAFAVVLPPQADDNPFTGQLVLTFVNPMADGRMEHLASGGRLYRRSR